MNLYEETITFSKNDKSQKNIDSNFLKNNITEDIKDNLAQDTSSMGFQESNKTQCPLNENNRTKNISSDPNPESDKPNLKNKMTPQKIMKNYENRSRKETSEIISLMLEKDKEENIFASENMSKKKLEQILFSLSRETVGSSNLLWENQKNMVLKASYKTQLVLLPLYEKIIKEKNDLYLIFRIVLFFVGEKGLNLKPNVKDMFAKTVFNEILNCTPDALKRLMHKQHISSGYNGEHPLPLEFIFKIGKQLLEMGLKIFSDTSIFDKINSTWIDPYFQKQDWDINTKYRNKKTKTTRRPTRYPNSTTDKSSDEFSDKTHKSIDKSNDESGDETYKKTQRPTKYPNSTTDESSEESSDEKIHKTTDESSKESSDEKIHKTTDESSEESSDEKTHKTNDEFSEESSDEKIHKTNDEFSEESSDEKIHKTNDESRDESRDEKIHKTNDESRDEKIHKTTDESSVMKDTVTIENCYTEDEVLKNSKENKKNDYFYLNDNDHNNIGENFFINKHYEGIELKNDDSDSEIEENELKNGDSFKTETEENLYPQTELKNGDSFKIETKEDLYPQTELKNGDSFKIETKEDPDIKTETKEDPDIKTETKEDPDIKTETKEDPDIKTETKEDPDIKMETTKPPHTETQDPEFDNFEPKSRNEIYIIDNDLETLSLDVGESKIFNEQTEPKIVLDQSSLEYFQKEYKNINATDNFFGNEYQTSILETKQKKRKHTPRGNKRKNNVLTLDSIDDIF